MTAVFFTEVLTKRTTPECRRRPGAGISAQGEAARDRETGRGTLADVPFFVRLELIEVRGQLVQAGLVARREGR